MEYENQLIMEMFDDLLFDYDELDMLEFDEPDEFEEAF